MCSKAKRLGGVTLPPYNIFKPKNYNNIKLIGTMEFNGYIISKTFFTNYNGVYVAFKNEAATVNGITFSHNFFFQYCKESHNDDYVNGKACVPFKPRVDDNFYMAIVNGGVIISTDLKNFLFQDTSLGYTNYNHIDVKDFEKYHNVEVEE